MIVSWSYILGAGPADGQPAEGQELVRRIVDSWRQRHQTIRNLRCWAKVDSFYAKGSLSRTYGAMDEKEHSKPQPARDTWFRGEPQEWAFDFERNRVRKTYRRTQPYHSGRFPDAPPQFMTDASVYLFENGNFTWIHSWQPSGTPGQKLLTRQQPWYQDVALYKRMSHAFVLSTPEDAPLLWWAGGVTSSLVNPNRLQHLDSVESFTFLGRSTLNDKDCVILRMTQQPGIGWVCEFWIGVNPPHAIYRQRCIDNQGNCIVQTDVQYRPSDSHTISSTNSPKDLIPESWTTTSYRRLTRKTFTVEKYEWNVELQDSLFQARLEPGMGVWDVERDAKYLVDQERQLVPYRAGAENMAPGNRQTRWPWWSVVLGMAAGVCLAFILWRT